IPAPRRPADGQRPRDEQRLDRRDLDEQPARVLRVELTDALTIREDVGQGRQRADNAARRGPPDRPILNFVVVGRARPIHPQPPMGTPRARNRVRRRLACAAIGSTTSDRRSLGDSPAWSLTLTALALVL